MSEYLKFSIRRILSRPFFTLINVLGIGVGFAVVTILTLHILQETSYDQYHKYADRTYKVISRFTDGGGQSGTMSITLGSLADDYKSKFPEVADASLFYGPSTFAMDLPDERLDDLSVVYSDYSFLQMFELGLTGDFSSPKNALISREVATSRFADRNPIGQVVRIDGIEYEISGILDIPKNTQFQFDVLLPLSSFPDINEWKTEGGMEFETYVRLHKQADVQIATAKLTDYYNQAMKTKWPQWQPDNFLIPMTDVYLNESGVRNRMGNGNKTMLWVIGSVAMVILILALINYLNLQIANNHFRRGEIQIRKTLGAESVHIVIQNVMESVLISILAGGLAILLIEVILKSDIIGLLSNTLPQLSEWSVLNWITFFLVVVLIGMLAGLLPGIKLYRINLVSQTLSKKLSLSTVSLVVFQFFISSALLTSVLFIHRQLNYLSEIPKGYNDENVLVIKNLNEAHKGGIEEISAALKTIPGIVDISISQSEPGGGTSGQGIRRAEQDESQEISINHIRTLEGFVETYDLQLVAGKGFDEAATQSEFIINEAASKKLFNSDENPIGHAIVMSGRQGIITGVVKDFHYRSFHHAIDPIVVNKEMPYYITLGVKINEGSTSSVIPKIEQVLATVDPLYTLDYRFLDEGFDRSHRKELNAKSIISYSTVIAFFISVLGLLGLTIFVINNKLKEIAIRKTLGAGEARMFIDLSTKLVSWIVMGNVLAIPVTYWIVTNWIGQFTYQVSVFELSWMIPLGLGATLTVSFLTIGTKLWQAIQANPVEYLRND